MAQQTSPTLPVRGVPSTTIPAKRNYQIMAMGDQDEEDIGAPMFGGALFNKGCNLSSSSSSLQSTKDMTIFTMNPLTDLPDVSLTPGDTVTLHLTLIGTKSMAGGKKNKDLLVECFKFITACAKVPTDRSPLIISLTTKPGLGTQHTMSILHRSPAATHIGAIRCRRRIKAKLERLLFQTNTYRFLGAGAPETALDYFYLLCTFYDLLDPESFWRLVDFVRANWKSERLVLWDAAANPWWCQVRESDQYDWPTLFRGGRLFCKP